MYFYRKSCTDNRLRPEANDKEIIVDLMQIIRIIHNNSADKKKLRENPRSFSKRQKNYSAFQAAFLKELSLYFSKAYAAVR